jgi:BMFP domain-containing protein YqiC
MRLYQRARRARIKAERDASEPIVDAAIPRGALMKESRQDLSRMWAKVDAIGPSDAVITKTHGRLDVLKRKDFEARHTSPAAHPPSRAVALYQPPASMIADGGRPADRSGFSNSIASETAFFRANMTASLDILAREAVETKRELAAQERRIAALEAAAERSANTNQFAQAVLGLFSYAVRH